MIKRDTSSRKVVVEGKDRAACMIQRFNKDWNFLTKHIHTKVGESTSTTIVTKRLSDDVYEIEKTYVSGREDV